jgi:hypothetical protein
VAVLAIVNVRDPGKPTRETVAYMLAALKPASVGIVATRHLKNTVISEEAHDRIEVMGVNAASKSRRVCTEAWVEGSGKVLHLRELIRATARVDSTHPGGPCALRVTLLVQTVCANRSFRAVPDAVNPAWLRLNVVMSDETAELALTSAERRIAPRAGPTT